MSDKQPVPTGLQLTAADAVFRERPHEYLDRLRSEDPVHRDAELGRLFLTRFEDAGGRFEPSTSVDPRKAPSDSYYRRILSANEPIEAFQAGCRRGALRSRRAAVDRYLHAFRDGRFPIP